MQYYIFGNKALNNTSKFRLLKTSLKKMNKNNKNLEYCSQIIGKHY